MPDSLFIATQSSAVYTDLDAAMIYSLVGFTISASLFILIGCIWLFKGLWK